MQSQNGATVIATASGQAYYSSPQLVTNLIPGTTAKYLGGVLRGDADIVLRYVGAWWNRHVEPIEQAAGNWGYDLRSIRGQTTGYSNHAAGEAIDTNAARHPLGTRTLGARKLSQLAGLADTLRGVVRFGAFYNGRVDEMHSEINQHGAPLAQLAADIRGDRMAEGFAELLGGAGATISAGHGTGNDPEEDDMYTDEDRRLAQEINRRLILITDGPMSIGARVVNLTDGDNSIGGRVVRVDQKVDGIAAKLDQVAADASDARLRLRGGDTGPGQPHEKLDVLQIIEGKIDKIGG
jgi:hypothetical protein